MNKNVKSDFRINIMKIVSYSLKSNLFLSFTILLICLKKICDVIQNQTWSQKIR